MARKQLAQGPRKELLQSLMPDRTLRYSADLKLWRTISRKSGLFDIHPDKTVMACIEDGLIAVVDGKRHEYTLTLKGRLAVAQEFEACVLQHEPDKWDFLVSLLEPGVFINRLTQHVYLFNRNGGSVRLTDRWGLALVRQGLIRSVDGSKNMTATPKVASLLQDAERLRSKNVCLGSPDAGNIRPDPGVSASRGDQCEDDPEGRIDLPPVGEQIPDPQEAAVPFIEVGFLADHAGHDRLGKPPVPGRRDDLVRDGRTKDPGLQADQ